MKCDCGVNQYNGLNYFRIADQEVGVCLPGAIRRGAARLGLVVNQYIPKGAEGMSEFS